MSCILYDFTIYAANCQPLCANVCAEKTNRKEGVRTSADSGEIGIRILASRRRQVTSALTRRRRLIHRRARSNPLSQKTIGIRILASRRRSVRLGSDLPPAGHSLPSPFESIISKKIIGIRILASRRRSVRLGSDAPQAPHSLPSLFESIISKNNRDSNSRVSTTLGQARL